MPRKIFWSKSAENDLIKLIEYLLLNWNKKVANNYLDLLENITHQISKNPKIYPIINKEIKIHKCVVSKHNSLYYQVTESNIEILRLFDNRQNPNKIDFR
jgi:plasmid stabilization system protein ParE